jgi:hypothetical protein
VLPWLFVCLHGPKHGLNYYVPLTLIGLGLVWLAHRRPRAWMHSVPARVLDMLGFNLLVMLLTAEIVLRSWIVTGGAPAWISSTPDPVRYRLDPAQTYFGSHPNSRGFFDEEWTPAPAPGVWRVAVLGDSFVVGIVPLRENYVTLADDALGPDIELLNLGVVHTEVPEYLQVLRTEGLPRRPDLVVLSFYIGNDIHDVVTSELFSASGCKTLQAVRVLWRVLSTGGIYGEIDRAEESPLVDEPDGTRTEVPMMTEREHLDREWKHLDSLFRDPPDRGMRDSWRDTERAIRRFVAECRAAGVPVVATIAPDEIQVDPELLARVAGERGVPAEEFDLEYPNRRLLALFAELDVPALDFLPALRAAQAEAVTYHPRAVHWNRRGNAAVAAVLVPWLDAQLATPLAAQRGD